MRPRGTAEAFRGRIHSVRLGIEPGFVVGGDTAMPFGGAAERPALALEVAESALNACPDVSADLLCLRLEASSGNTEAHCMAVANAIKAGLPLIVVGSGDREDDLQTLPAIARRFSRQRLVLGSATEDTYQPIALACRDFGHVMIAESPIDINICKQLNILATDAGLPLDSILIDPTTGGLGYGIEYTYSIMEKARLAALQGDRMLACPQVCFVGAENWRLKEASPAWEAVAATALLMAGASIVVLRDPSALGMVRENIDALLRPHETGESRDTDR